MKNVIPILFIITALTACSLFGTDSDSGPDIPGKIVFSAKDEAGTSQIYTMKANGTDVRQLTHFGPEGGCADPAWSPDGQRIVFANYTGATTLGPYLYVMDVDGGNMHQLKRREGSSIQGLVGSAPTWSPDGTKIAYQVCTNCERGGKDYEIVIVDVAGQTYDPAQVHTVTDHPASDADPTWSPNSQRIAFVSNRDYGDADTLRFRKDLYVINSDGTGLQRLTEEGYAKYQPKWSPDGTKIAYDAYDHNFQGNITFLYQIGTAQIMKLRVGLEFAGYPLWINQGNQLLIFGRETEQSTPVMKWIEIGSKSTNVLQTIKLNKKLIARDYDWHSGQ